MATNWFRAHISFADADALKVDRELGVIFGASINTVGEAKGHGVFLDEDFVSDVVRMGKGAENGIKARFGHPAMSGSAIGTYLGRFRNFRQDGDHARADLYLSDTAKATPQGDLYEYVLNMAEKEPDMFGISIVFEPGKTYRRDETGKGVEYGTAEYAEAPRPDFATIKKLHAADVVDEPAANNGLFSAFSAEHFAARASEFLDENPDIYTLLAEHPEVVEGFMARYEAYAKNTQTETSNTNKEVVMTPEMFDTIEQAFGAEMAAKCFKEGLTYEQAEELQTKQQNEELHAKIDEMQQQLSDAAEKLSAAEKQIAQLQAEKADNEAAPSTQDEPKEPKQYTDAEKVKMYVADGMSKTEAWRKIHAEKAK